MGPAARSAFASGGDLGGQAGVRDDQLAVDLERAAAAALVEEGEHEGRHGLAGDVLLGGCGEAVLDQRLDVHAILGRIAEEQTGAAELPVGPRNPGGLL